MEDMSKLREVSLDEMFGVYLTCGGEPTEEDWKSFVYTESPKSDEMDGEQNGGERVKKAIREVDLGPKICAIGTSVVKRTGAGVVFRHIPASRRGGNLHSSGRRRSFDTRSSESEDENSQWSEDENEDSDEDDTPSRCTFPDIAIYGDNERPQDSLITAPTEYKAETKTEDEADIAARQECVGERSWNDIVVIIEAKIVHHQSAFEFNHPEKGLLRSRVEGGTYAFNQFLEHIAQVFGHQHRTHLLAAYVYRDQARIAYVDRSGGVVSAPFRYGTPVDNYLHRFFWKVAHMTDKELGFDESARLAQAADVVAMRNFAANLPTEYLRKQAFHALSWNAQTMQLTSREWPMYQLAIARRTVFAGRPSFATPSLFGRGTRGYPVFEKVEDDDGTSWYLRFLKDSWKVNNGRAEHTVYRRLQDNDVRDYIPECLSGDDVRDTSGSPQLTRVHDIDGRGYQPRSHYRILLADVCRPLEDFKDFRELAGLLRDALQGHKDAWEKARILHRDVSFNNILILETVSPDGSLKRKGVLSDWELSKYRENMETGKGPTQPDHTGTWYFRSAASVNYPCKPYELSDDVESFVHVYHYSVLRYHSTNHTGLYLQAFFRVVYASEALRSCDGAHLGSFQKLMNMRLPTAFIHPMYNRTLLDKLRELAKLYSQHYAAIEEEDYDAKYGSEYASEIPESLQSASDASEEPLPAARRRREPRWGPDPLRTLDDHTALLDAFASISRAHWTKHDLKKSKVDYFKEGGLAPLKNNHYSSSGTFRGQDLPVHVNKRRKTTAGSNLESVSESQES